MKQERAYLIFDHNGRHYELKTKYKYLSDAEKERLIQFTKDVIDMKPRPGQLLDDTDEERRP